MGKNKKSSGATEDVARPKLHCMATGKLYDIQQVYEMPAPPSVAPGPNTLLSDEEPCAGYTALSGDRHEL